MMKEFEKHIQKEYPHITTGDTMFANDIWRAALKWVAEMYRCSYDPIDVISDIYEEIDG